MQHARPIPAVASIVVGGLTAVQARVNGELSHMTGNGLEAAAYSFGSGLVILTVLAMTVPSIRAGVMRVPRAVRSGELRWWHVFGGVLGGYFVAAQSISVPMVGVAIFTIAVVAGQSTNSLVVDRIGLGPAGKQAVTTRRVLSAVLAIAAVTLAVANRVVGQELAASALVLALLAGVGIAVQQAINGRVGIAARNPLSATAINFFFGTLVLATGFAVSVGLAGWPMSPLFVAPWWAYFGGIIGIAFIAVAAWAVPIVGVLLFALLSIAGQLAGALLLDLLVPTHGSSVTWNLVAGVLLAFVAVAVSALRPGARTGR